MGLDMYLKARTGVGMADWLPPDEQIKFQMLEREFVAEDLVCPEFKFAEVEFCAIYWRKSNQIHRWFVDNVQGGVDNGGRYYVAVDELKKLEELCIEALETRDPTLLPPQEGFFFGSTEINDSYWGDIEYTLKSLKRIKPFANRYDFEYWASW